MSKEQPRFLNYHIRSTHSNSNSKQTHIPVSVGNRIGKNLTPSCKVDKSQTVRREILKTSITPNRLYHIILTSLSKMTF